MIIEYKILIATIVLYILGFFATLLYSFKNHNIVKTLSFVYVFFAGIILIFAFTVNTNAYQKLTEKEKQQFEKIALTNIKWSRDNTNLRYESVRTHFSEGTHSSGSIIVDMVYQDAACEKSCEQYEFKAEYMIHDSNNNRILVDSMKPSNVRLEWWNDY